MENSFSHFFFLFLLREISSTCLHSSLDFRHCFPCFVSGPAGDFAHSFVHRLQSHYNCSSSEIEKSRAQKPNQTIHRIRRINFFLLSFLRHSSRPFSCYSVRFGIVLVFGRRIREWKILFQISSDAQWPEGFN